MHIQHVLHGGAISYLPLCKYLSTDIKGIKGAVCAGSYTSSRAESNSCELLEILVVN